MLARKLLKTKKPCNSKRDIFGNWGGVKQPFLKFYLNINKNSNNKGREIEKTQKRNIYSGLSRFPLCYEVETELRLASEESRDLSFMDIPINIL
jgi:hypothetical protein